MAGGRAGASAPKMEAPGGTGGLLDSHWVPDSSTMFNGSNSTTDVEGQFGDRKTRSPAFFQAGEIGSAAHEGEDMELEGCSQLLSRKKRRLSAHQVQFLEKSFEVENRLEPERKTELAKELGLQPRQVAIWFQNRRARFKTKQMEKDYDSLGACYDALKANYDSLLKESEKLKHEVDSLKRKLLGDGCSEETRKARPWDGEPQESSGHLTAEQGNSSQGPDHDSSEIEDDSSGLVVGGDSLLVAPHGLPKIEDGYDCSFEFSSEDHPFWNWSYN
ncbi:hypothetical protein SAY86_009112 [Trapa natans]|uniref:Homeobox-leucine zipper protein n=1 Tax=Trapa natans TaxID=22666 RepID=A0AAN7KAH0_TRANT|nr:hypothetical protein SAY86_009112 [Trapa natans]